MKKTIALTFSSILFICQAQTANAIDPAKEKQEKLLMCEVKCAEINAASTACIALSWVPFVTPACMGAAEIATAACKSKC